MTRSVLPGIGAACLVAALSAAPARAADAPPATAGPTGAAPPAAASSTPVPPGLAPSAASIDELFVVTNAAQLLESSYAQVETAMRQSVAGVPGIETLRPEQRRILDDMMRDVAAMLREEMAWERMRPVFVEVYRRTFTQSEVDGMLEFYRTPAGQAVIAKLPAVQAQAMQLVQEQVKTMLPKLQQIQRDALQRLMESAQSPPESAPPPSTSS